MKTLLAAIKNYTAKYDYEKPEIPFLAAIRAATLAAIESGSHGMWKPEDLESRMVSHDEIQNTMIYPPEVLEQISAARERHRLRQAPALRFDSDSLFHRRISARQPGTILARQREIDYRMLLTAHWTPGVSMTDNLARMTSPSARRLARR